MLEPPPPGRAADVRRQLFTRP